MQKIVSIAVNWTEIQSHIYRLLLRRELILLKNNVLTPGLFVGIFHPLVYGGQKADCQFIGGYMCLINHAIDCEHSCKRD